MTPLTEITLELLEGSDDQTSRIVTLKDNETVFVQRASEDTSKNLPSSHANFNINNGAVSRLHATLTCKPKHSSSLDSTSSRHHHTVYVTDEKSRHGTYVNDTRLKEDVEHELFDGDIIKFGIDIDRPQEREYHGFYVGKNGFIDRYPVSFKAPQYLVSFKHISDTNSGLRGISYSVPDDIDSIADSENPDAYSDVESVLHVAETNSQNHSDIIDLTEQDVDAEIQEQGQRVVLEDPASVDDLIIEVDEGQVENNSVDNSVSEHCDLFSEVDPFSEADSFAAADICKISTTAGSVMNAVVEAVEVVEAVQGGQDPSSLNIDERPVGLTDAQVLYADLDPVTASPSQEWSLEQGHRKRKFDDVEDFHEQADEKDEEEWLREARRWRPNRGCIVSTDPARPVKRSRLGMAALGIGMFLAGSTTTFAALAYLPDIA